MVLRSIEDQISDILGKNDFKQHSNGTYAIDQATLQKEAERLKGLLEKHIRAYYDSYSPKKYVRYDPPYMAKSLEMRVNKNGDIAISFGGENEDLLWGDSVVDPRDGGNGFQPILIDTGWQVGSKVPFANKYRFGHYEGWHFIEKAIKEFNANNPNGITVRVNINTHANYKAGNKFKIKRSVRDYYDRMGTM